MIKAIVTGITLPEIPILGLTEVTVEKVPSLEGLPSVTLTINDSGLVIKVYAAGGFEPLISESTVSWEDLLTLGGFGNQPEVFAA